MTLDGETYIGDGVYASYDGWQIQLRAPRSDGDHFVYIEPTVFSALIKFAEKKCGWKLNDNVD